MRFTSISLPVVCERESTWTLCMVSVIVLVLFVAVIMFTLCLLLADFVTNPLVANFLILVAYLLVVISWLNYLYQLKIVGKCLSFPHLPSAILFYFLWFEFVHKCVGTDTVGCVRTPASLCGILGFRPSHGSVSSVGVLPNSQSLDTVGTAASFFNVVAPDGSV